MADFVIRKGDRLPELSRTLKDETGTAINLTGATVRFHMRVPAGGSAKVDAAATVVSAANGQVKYVWTSGDTDTAGAYIAEFQVTFSDTRRQSFPNPGFIEISVTDALV